MEAKHIRPSTNVKDHDYYDILVQAINGDFDLFTVIKNDFTVHYDYCEIQTCPDTQEKQFTVQEMDESRHYPREEIIQLSIDALKELVLVKKIEGHKLALVFPPPTNDHKLNTAINLDVIELDDVFIDMRSFKKPSKIKHRRSLANHIMAIEAALQDLGADAENIDIYKWIKQEAEKPNDINRSFMNYLDFDDEDIYPFSVTDQKATILKSKEVPVTKQTFQDAVSKVKKNFL